MHTRKINLPPKVAGPGTRVALRLGGDPFAHLERLRAVPADMMQFRVAGERAFLVKDPELIQQVLVTKNRSFAKGRSLERARIVFGNGLLTSEGDFYLRQRRVMQPAFHSQRIRSFGETMVQHAMQLMEGWQNGETRDLVRDMTRLTLGVFTETLLGSDVKTEGSRVSHAIATLLKYFPLLMLPFGPALRHLPLPPMRRMRKAQAELRDALFPIINARRQEKEEQNDLLSLLLGAQDPESSKNGHMTDEQLYDEVLIMFLAGHETTTVAFCWTWYLLSQNPEVETKLHAEVDRVLANGRTPTTADFSQLDYARKVIRESMRLYPPVWMITRRAKEACEIGSYDVPERTLVMMSQWMMHRDARYFEAPADFRPERWTPEFEADLPRFAYFPFGGGQRSCIGEGFALLELVLVLATLARQWRFRLDPGAIIEPNPLFTLRLKHGLPMRLEKRTARASQSLQSNN